MNESDTTVKSEKSLANLTPWKPGQSGNPNGRPPSLVTELKKIAVEKRDDKTRLAEIAQEVYHLAETNQGRGQIPAMVMIRDSIDGPPSQSLLITGSITHTTPQLELEAQKRLRDAADEERLLIEGVLDE